MENLSRPFRRYGGSDFRALSSVRHLSCWDCEHLRVGNMPFRTCLKRPNKAIYGPGPADMEAEQEAKDNYKVGTVADRCRDFQVASEFGFLLPLNVVPEF
jgi:hypothetical protein